MAYLVQSPSGETMTVQSLDGHDGWTVLDDSAPDTAIEDLKRLKRSEVDALLARGFARGFTPSTGPLAGHTLQTRDVTDRTNWLTSQASYAAAIAAGYGDVADASFRTAANETITVTYSQGHAALMEMAAWGKALFGKSWAVKDQIDTLTGPSEVAGFDVGAAWEAA